jgi:CRISPR-associated protein Cas6
MADALMESVLEPVVDLTFMVSGGPVPLDHGYALYSAVSKAVPELHGVPWLGIHPLSGIRTSGTLLLNRASRLRLRLPVERITVALPLAGKGLDVGGAPLVVGVPAVRALRPAEALHARLVVIKLTSFPVLSTGRVDEKVARESVLKELGRQMQKAAIEGRVSLGALREIRVSGKRVLGFAVRVEGLDALASLRLQAAGLGGKRRMGCGLFVPTR